MSEGYAYVWEFVVAPEQRAEFLRHYGPEGEWARLFRRAPGYIGTLLLEDRGVAGRFLTVDRWRSVQDHEAFVRDYRAEYQRLDRACEAFAQREARLGSYRELV